MSDEQPGQAGQVGQVGQVGQAGQVGREGQVGQVDRVGQIDQAIDEIARQITEGAPDAGFKARVLARIETIETRDGRSWSRRWVWALAPLAAVAVLAALVVRAPGRSDTHVAQEVRREVADEVRLKPDTTYEKLPSEGAIDGPNGGPVRVRPTYRRPTYVGRAVSGPAAVSDFAPIDIEPLGVEAMDLTPLGIEAMEPIVVTRLSLAPLEVPAIGEQ